MLSEVERYNKYCGIIETEKLKAIRDKLFAVKRSITSLSKNETNILITETSEKVIIINNIDDLQENLIKMLIVINRK